MADDKKTVLVVDDEPDVVTFICTVLQDHGYEAISAEDGQQATDKVKEKRPDLISLDITMPEKSGVKFYREMKESDEYKDIPIVIVTGLAQDFKKFISSRRQVPAPEGYLSKPISKDDVIDAVKKLIG